MQIKYLSDKINRKNKRFFPIIKVESEFLIKEFMG